MACDLGVLERAAKSTRFVKTRAGDRALYEASLARAQSLVGLKVYVTNVPVTEMPASEVIARYHELWRVERSLRMSKSDLRARPMFHHTRDAIEAHLTIAINGTTETFPPEIPEPRRQILNRLTIPEPGH